MRSLARSLVLAGGITTTEAKAKALRPFVERMVTARKNKTLGGIRKTATELFRDEKATARLTEIAKEYADRAGGYTRITRLPRVGTRVAAMAKIEFV